MKFEIGKNLGSSFTGAVGVISAIVSLGWPDVKSISIWWVNLTITISLWFIIFMLMYYTEIKMHCKILEQENRELKGRGFYEVPFKIYEYHDKRILLIHSNEIFANATHVGIYYKMDGYEHLAFIGKIENAQTDKKLQIEIVLVMPMYTEFEINTNTVGNFMVRPSFPTNTEFMEYLSNASQR